MDRDDAMRMAGLRMHDVFSVYSLTPTGVQEGATPLWSGLAASPIHAMDMYVKSVDSTYTGYTSLIDSGDPDELESVYEYRGRLCGILENTEICAIERPAEFPAVVDGNTVDAAIDEATDAFWAAVHRNFPYDTGDLDPLTVNAFMTAMRAAVNAWVAANAPRRYAAVLFDVSGMTEIEADHLVMQAAVQGEQDEHHPEAASTVVQASFAGTLDDLIDDLPESWQRD